MLRALLILVAGAGGMGPVAAYDESVDGELSGDERSPTPVALTAGANTISGTTTDSPLDRDFFVVELSPAQRVDSIVLETYRLTGNLSDGGSLLAVEDGPVISDIATGFGLLGFAIVGVSSGQAVGDELLDDLAEAPLTDGAYTFWMQNTGAGTEYALRLEVNAVGPPPVQNIPTLGLSGLLVLGLVFVLVAWRHGRFAV